MSQKIKNNPCCRLIAVMTMDGKIARHKKHIVNWSSSEDKKFLRSMMNKSDVIVVGDNTYRTARKILNKYNIIVFRSGATSKVTDNRLYLNPTKLKLTKITENNNYKNIIVLGGRHTYSWFLKNNLIDEIYLTVEPLVFGRGMPLFETKIKQQNFKLRSVKKLNKQGSLLLNYIR